MVLSLAPTLTSVVVSLVFDTNMANFDSMAKQRFVAMLAAHFGTHFGTILGTQDKARP